MKRTVNARPQDRAGETNAGDLLVGDRVAVKPDMVKTVAWALLMGSEPISAKVTNIYPDNSYAVQPDGSPNGYYVHGEALELTGEARRCQRPDCQEVAVNGLCETHQRRQEEIAAVQTSQVSQRIARDADVRSGAASKAWETRRRRQEEEDS